MNRGFRNEVVMVVVSLLIATAAIAASGADLKISSWFYISGSWPVGQLFPWQLLYRLDRIPAFSLALFGLAAYTASFFRADLLRWRRWGLFLVVLMALGPGLIVNAVFKDHWGRPRPREVTPFGGKKQFLQPWQKGEDGKGRSFPSGHASSAFFLSAPFFIYRLSNRRLSRLWLGGGIVFGILMSIARITQGGHFLSDTVWAWGMVHLTAVILSHLFGLDREVPAPPATGPATCST